MVTCNIRAEREKQQFSSELNDARSAADLFSNEKVKHLFIIAFNTSKINFFAIYEFILERNLLFYVNLNMLNIQLYTNYELGLHASIM